MEQYLDSTGLQLYDSKIKTYISDTVSVLNDDISELNTKVSALNGAIRYIGKIEQFTADVTQQLLTQTAAGFGYETLEIGLTLVDKNANDWVVCEPDSETPWVNIGYYELNIATQSELGLVKGGEQISVDNNGELHLVKLSNNTSGLNLNLTGGLSVSGSINGNSLSIGTGGMFNVGTDGYIQGYGISLGTGAQFTVSTTGNIHGSGISIGTGNQFNVNVDGDITGNSLSIGNGSQFTVSTTGNIHGSGISIGTGSQFTVSTTGNIHGSGISIGSGSQFSVDSYGSIHGSIISIGTYSEFEVDQFGNIKGNSLSIGTGSQFTVTDDGHITGSNIYMNVGNGTLTGNGFNIQSVNGYGYMYLRSGGIAIYDAGGGQSNVLELSCLYGQPSIKLGTVNIVTSGSRIDAQYLTGNISTGISFSTLSNEQIYELKTILGI